MRVAINGFGRIGRLCFRSLRKRYPGIEIVAINDLTDPAHNAHLLKYDTNYGPYDGTVSADGRSLIVDGERIDIYAERDWTNLPWRDLGDRRRDRGHRSRHQARFRRTPPGRGRAPGRHLGAVL